MGDATRALEFVDAAISEAAARGVALVTAEDEELDGRQIRLGGRAKLNFSSCSYLGLELDPRLKRGAIEAVERYGTQFSSSRTYISAPLYEELESLLDRITGGSTLVTPNTTLGHLSALPVLIGEDDAAILDHQVHHTVQLAVPQLRAQGTHVELLRHGRVDQLDERIRALSRSHRRVWYLADGIYSMYGDFAPMKAINWLKELHDQLHVYIDDAHGMSWCGRHGRGFALEQLEKRDRTVVAVSLNKAFGAAGGALVFPDGELRRKVRTCGGPMIFTGPVQPPMLGAAIASARIHLSDEITSLQRDLADRIGTANALAREFDLPLASDSQVPIRYVGLGLPAAAYDMASHLLEQGIYANCAVFPAVRAKCSGLRFTLTRHQSQDDIRTLLETVAEHLPKAVAASGGSREDIDRAFSLTPSRRRGPTEASATLRCQHETTIAAIDAVEWDRCLGGRGTFGWNSLATLERIFGLEQEPENRWSFHYYVVRDASGRIVLATFFSEALWKDDLVAEESISRAVEAQRVGNPYFLTSSVLAMGSLFSEGDHLFLDRDADWRGALGLLLAAVAEERQRCNATMVVLRDFAADDEEIALFLRSQGFIALALPDSMVVDLDWRDDEEFLARLSPRARRFQQRKVMPLDDAYAVEVLGKGGRRPSDDELAHLYDLYRNVKDRSFTLNTFPLPEGFLRPLLETPGWEIVTFTLKPEFGGPESAPPQAFGACYAGPQHYAPVVLGLDYAYVQDHGAYRQCHRHAILRAREHGVRRVLMGMGAPLEKARFGAVAERRVLYAQSHDHFQHDVLTLIGADPGA